MVLLCLGPHEREIHAQLWDVRVRRERRRGKQLLQQKHEAGGRCPGSETPASPRLPAPHPTRPGLLLTLLTSQGSEHRSLRNANLGVQACSREEDAPQTTRGVSPGHGRDVVWAPFSHAAARSRPAPWAGA